MAKIPYYGIGQANSGQLQQDRIVDEYQGLREGLNKAQTFVEQSEAIETSKLLAKARSEWNIKLAQMQEETGLDAEGFMGKVQQQMSDYESSLINQVPMSQRKKFSAEFAGIKYDMFTKSGLYEAKALSEKTTKGFKEIADYNANSVLSDFTQRGKITEDSDDMIDELKLSESAKHQLKVESHNKYAVAEINARTDVDPYALQKNLVGGVYDDDITPEQKAAALRQVANRIKANEQEVKIRAGQMLSDELNSDLMSILNGEVNDMKLDEMKRKTIYAKNPKAIEKINSVYNTWMKNKQNDLQTVLDMENGQLMNPSKADKSRLDTAYLKGSSESNTFQDRLSLGERYVKQTNYIPSGLSREISNMYNSSNNEERKIAAESWFRLKRDNPNISSGLSLERSNEMYAMGVALNSGYSLPDIEERISKSSSPEISSIRKTQANKILKKGIKFGFDSDFREDPSIMDTADNIFYSWYLETGSEEVAKEMAVKYVDENYGYSNVSGKDFYTSEERSSKGGFVDTLTSFIPDFRTGSHKLMFQPPEKEYKNPNLSDKENLDWMREDLLKTVHSLAPDVEDKYIDIDNVLLYSEEGKPVYVVTYKGQNLVANGRVVRWVPNWREYNNSKGE